jgi:predicted RNA-binding protein YlxR (DUF448 family)
MAGPGMALCIQSNERNPENMLLRVVIPQYGSEES